MPDLPARITRLFILLLLLVSCAPLSTATDAEAESSNNRGGLTLPDLSSVRPADGNAPRVVATTSIMGDVIRNVAGDHIDLTVLMAPGQDPHSYQPTAADLTAVSRANILFVNGWGLEEGLLAVLEGALSDGAAIVPISAGIEPLCAAGTEGLCDPHVWFAPENVLVWVSNIETVLSSVDSSDTEAYRENAAAYAAQIAALEAESRDRLAAIPTDRRKLVTNHDTLAYFARAYDFEIIGTIVPGASTGIEPSASDLTELTHAIRDAGVNALFIETTVSDTLAQVLVEESGVRVYTLYTDALGPAGSGADTYIGMFERNINTLVEALGE